MPSSRPQLTPEDRDYLRMVARKTWDYFETFVTEEHHWLPPDNVQIDPDGADRRPHLADQHRDGAAVDAVGARPRVHRHRTR